MDRAVDKAPGPRRARRREQVEVALVLDRLRPPASRSGGQGREYPGASPYGRPEGFRSGRVPHCHLGAQRAQAFSFFRTSHQRSYLEASVKEPLDGRATDPPRSSNDYDLSATHIVRDLLYRTYVASGR